MAVPLKLTYRQSDFCQIRRYCKNFWFCSKIYPNDLQMRSKFGIAKVNSEFAKDFRLNQSCFFFKKKTGLLPIFLIFVNATMNYGGPSSKHLGEWEEIWAREHLSLIAGYVPLLCLLKLIWLNALVQDLKTTEEVRSNRYLSRHQLKPARKLGFG